MENFTIISNRHFFNVFVLKKRMSKKKIKKKKECYGGRICETGIEDEANIRETRREGKKRECMFVCLGTYLYVKKRPPPDI